MKIEDLKNRVDELINKAGEVLQTRRKIEYSEYVSSELFNEFRVSSLSFLRNVFGIDNPFYTEFDKKVIYSSPYQTEDGRGILKAVKQEINGGWLFTIKGLISAEVFSDYLEMAEHLLNEGYKDPAAVLVGSTLEVHLREICISNSISINFTNSKDQLIPKKADLMNSDLAKANVYSSAYQKQIIAWLGIRNSAAHGKYSDYTTEEISLMLQGIRNFILTIK